MSRIPERTDGLAAALWIVIAMPGVAGLSLTLVSWGDLRLDAIGGNLEIQSKPGEGTLVRGSVRLTTTAR